MWCVCDFFYHQRLELFHKYATNAMCKAGIPVLDVYPMTASYLNGTLDHVHYNANAQKVAEDQLLISISNGGNQENFQLKRSRVGWRGVFTWVIATRKVYKKEETVRQCSGHWPNNLQTCLGYEMADSHQTHGGEVALQIITYQEEMRYGVSSPPRTQCNKLEWKRPFI